MMGIKKVVAGSRNRKREKKMNATTQAKTRNVYVRDIMMPVVFCKDCKYSTEPDAYRLRVCRRMCGLSGFTDYDFCSKGERRDEDSC